MDFHNIRVDYSNSANTAIDLAAAGNYCQLFSYLQAYKTQKMKTKFGINQWFRPAPKKVKILFEVISYLLAGVAVTSWVQSNPDMSVILLLVAGGIDKFAPRFFGEESDFKE